MKNIIYFLGLFLWYPLFSQSTSKSKMIEIPFHNISPYIDKVAPTYFNSTECRQSYFKINLTSFDIAVDRKYLKKYQPIAYIKVTIGDNKKVIKIVGNESIKIINEGKNTFIRSIKNTSIVGFLPYTGEDITVSVSLYAYKTEDKIQDAIELAQEITSLFPNELSLFLNLTNKIYSNVEKIISNSDYLISYQHTFNAFRDEAHPNSFKEGYYVILNSNSPATGYDFSIRNLDILYENEPIDNSGLNYIILNFEHSINIPDYQKFSFYITYKEALNYARKGNEKIAMELYKNVLDKIYASDNLTDYNKMTLHRYLYGNLIPDLLKINPDFDIGNTPTIDCLERSVYGEMLVGELIEKYDENRKEIKRDKFYHLKKEIQIDEKINFLIEKGFKQPNDIIKEAELF